MMEASASISATSNRSRDSVASDAAEDVWSPDPSSGYCSADDDPLPVNLRTPTETGSRYDRRSSESSGGISSKSLLSLSLSEALSLTLRESPSPSPTPDDVLSGEISMDFRSPTSFIDYNSSFASAISRTPGEEFPLLRIVKASNSRKSNFDRQIETRTVTKKTYQRLSSLDIETGSLSLEDNSNHHMPSDDLKSHLHSSLQLTSSCEENTELSRVALSQASSRSDVSENAIINESGEVARKLSENVLNVHFNGSDFEENVENDNSVHLVTADGSLKKLLPTTERKKVMSIDAKPILEQSRHRLLGVPPRVDSFDTSFYRLLPEHSKEFVAVDEDSRRCNTSPNLCDTNAGCAGSMTLRVSKTSSTDCMDPVDLRALRVAIGFFHSYAAIEKSSDSCHSSVHCNPPQSQNLSFFDNAVDNDLSCDVIVETSLQSTPPADDQHLHDRCTSIWSPAADASEVLQETMEECNEPVRSKISSPSSVDGACVQKLNAKRSKASNRQNHKRRRRLSNFALAELEDHGYSLSATHRPTSLSRPSACPGTADAEETTADVSSVLAKLLLTQEQLFPNEGSSGFIARGRCHGDSATPPVQPGEGLESSGSLLEKLLTGEVDRDEIRRSEDRIIRDRMEVRFDEEVEDEVEEAEVDLQLQDFDTDSLELENLEELWKNYGDLLGKFLG